MTPLGRLLRYFRPYKGAFFLGSLCVLGTVVFALVKPVIIGRAVDHIRSTRSSAELFKYALEYVAATVGAALFVFLQRWIVLVRTSWRIDYDIRNDFYSHLQKLPLSFYQEQRTGDLMSRATGDLAAVRMLFDTAASYCASSVFLVVGTFVMMLRIDRVMALVPVVVIPVIVGVVQFFGREIHIQSKSLRDFFGNVSARVQENLAGVRVVRAFGQERNELETFKRMNREYVDRNRSLIRTSTLFHVILGFLLGGMYVSVFFIGSRRMMAGSLSIGNFVAFQFFLSRMIWPLLSLGWVINLFQRGLASMARLQEVWAVPEVVAAEGGADDAIRGEIEIRDLSFAYPGPGGQEARPALRNINLRVRSGQTVGIVGPTGAGKSTLLALLSRTFEPPLGTIFVDNRPLEATPLRQLRDSIGMVTQETFLFSDSIAENIRFGKTGATAEAVYDAAGLAGLSVDIQAFPFGLETMIGERGMTLSGGQKQRTAIARALVRDPRILLLDDALSAVDTQTEEKILRALTEIRRDRTVVVVSHRVSSVKDADLIVVLDEGRIVERGTHESLLAERGYYANLYRAQTLRKQLEETA